MKPWENDFFRLLAKSGNPDWAGCMSGAGNFTPFVMKARNKKFARRWRKAMKKFKERKGKPE